MISKQDVEHVAMLSRLEFNEAEKDEFTRQLNNILEYMDKLNALDTSGVEPMAHVLPLENVFREDVAKPSMPREMVLQNAPDEKGGMFKVPRII